MSRCRRRPKARHSNGDECPRWHGDIRSRRRLDGFRMPRPRDPRIASQYGRFRSLRHHGVERQDDDKRDLGDFARSQRQMRPQNRGQSQQLYRATDERRAADAKTRRRRARNGGKCPRRNCTPAPYRAARYRHYHVCWRGSFGRLWLDRRRCSRQRRTPRSARSQQNRAPLRNALLLCRYRQCK